jgi:type II secretory pathway predicted ATPase ExeA
MDLDHYGLTEMPFRLTPDDRFFFASQEHSRALSHLLFGLAQGEGFIVVTGEVGAGKTTLVERLSVRLGTDAYWLATIMVPHSRAEDIIKLVAAGFGMPTEGDVATVTSQLTRRLRAERARGRRALLIVDEAQSVLMPALEELRMLSNLAENGRALLQIVLLGQPQFRATMSSPELDQLSQRVLASYHIGALSREEVRTYVEHRMRMAGWQDLPRFEEAAFATIYDFTDGIPRRINRLCGRVLLHGTLEQADVITAALVESVARELDTDLTRGAARPNRTISDIEPDSGNLDRLVPLMKPKGVGR